MLTRRELLIGGVAGLVVSMLGRPAWSSTPPPPGAAAPASPLDAIMGKSPAITAFRDSLLALLDRVAGLPRLPVVLFLGETGTGKSLAAEVLHRAGPRSGGPFVPFIIPTFPEELLEAELYGYRSPGVWEGAAGGSLHLDEISLVRAGWWPQLVRTTQTEIVRRTGSSRRSVTIDAWTIMSTSVSLDTRVGLRALRDRIASLDPVTLTVPPLRARGDDVQLLADHSLARACRDYDLPEKVLTHAARRALGRYPWPGNARELSNVMELAVLLTERREIGADDLRI
jgi:two-component system, NtrC family, response regulator AtoC